MTRTADLSAEAQRAQAEVPRKKIPQKMWQQIAAAEERAKFTGLSIREARISVGQIHGFSETEMQKRGLIAPRPRPNPEQILAAALAAEEGETD
jgi:hypothetical protein